MRSEGEKGISHARGNDCNSEVAKLRLNTVTFCENPYVTSSDASIQIPRGILKKELAQEVKIKDTHAYAEIEHHSSF